MHKEKCSSSQQPVPSSILYPCKGYLSGHSSCSFSDNVWLSHLIGSKSYRMTLLPKCILQHRWGVWPAPQIDSKTSHMHDNILDTCHPLVFSLPPSCFSRKWGLIADNMGVAWCSPIYCFVHHQCRCHVLNPWSAKFLNIHLELERMYLWQLL